VVFLNLRFELILKNYREKQMWKTRAMRDVRQLVEAGFRVKGERGEDEVSDFRTFECNVVAPKDSAYEGFEYTILFSIPENFPFKSPSVGFRQRIFHPNVDEASGSICLDSLNKAWSPAMTLLNIVEVQLPYLMQYPNPADPFNRDAAAMMMGSPEVFRARVATHCKAYALPLTK
jgi:ubiquitin-conjugating enzyme E2 H